MTETMGDALGLQILRAVQEVGTRLARVEAGVNQLSTRIERLEARVEQLSERMEEDSRRMKKRLEVTSSTVILMAAVVRGPMAFSAELEAHLGELRAG
jgi:uncharacterized protein YlxW (UPF0749 family)